MPGNRFFHGRSIAAACQLRQGRGREGEPKLFSSPLLRAGIAGKSDLPVPPLTVCCLWPALLSLSIYLAGIICCLSSWLAACFSRKLPRAVGRLALSETRGKPLLPLPLPVTHSLSVRRASPLEAAVADGCCLDQAS